LVAIGLGLVTPLVSAQPESKLPACCRRDGKHACGMKRMKDSGSSSAGVTLRSGIANCPEFPTGKATPGAQKMGIPAPVRAVTVPIQEIISQVEQAGALFRVCYGRSCQERGPPALFA
jgi:hypothetical protein